jgi:uncharacterized protein (TIGR03083 family)
LSTPSYPELVTAIRREGEGLLAAAGMGLDADVPTCAGWDVAAVVNHVSGIYARVGFLVAERIAQAPESIPGVPAGEPIEVLSGLLDELVLALSECDADTPIWTSVFDVPGGAAFWARRMAHESAVHRFDAQAAHGVVQPIDSELASDGIDEMIDVIAPRLYVRDKISGPTGSVRFHSSDNDTWQLQLEPDGLHRIDAVDEADVTVNGTASALLLAAYSRMPWTSLEVHGDADLLTRWSTAMSF